MMMHRYVINSCFVFACCFLALIVGASVAEDGVTLSWNVTASLSSAQRKPLLQQVLGIARAGRVHALLGPSGCGKTTLLNALAGESNAKAIKLSGEIGITHEVSPVYIQQEDLLFAQLTAQETLDISDELRTQRSPIDRAFLVDKMLKDLGLRNISTTRVGDRRTRGLSGGEKKRLAIGNEILDELHDGSVIFADEPTSGLDCFQAQRVIELLRDIARQGNIVIASVHQPRAATFELFDDITLMSNGYVLFTGPKDQLVPYFESIGFPCPKNVSPAEYFIDLISVDYSSPEKEQQSRDRVQLMKTKFIELRGAHFAANKVQASSTLNGGSKRQAIVPKGKLRVGRLLRSSLSTFVHTITSSVRKFGILYNRAWKQVARDRPLHIARLASSLFSSLLFGAIYFKLGKSSKSVPDRLGLLQVAAVNTAMTSLIKATTSFVNEKQIVQKERKRGMYGVVPYFLAKLFAEIPLSSFFPCLFGTITYTLCGLNNAPGKLWKFLAALIVETMASTSLGMLIGSLVPTTESGVAVAPAVMVIFIVFGGLYVVNAPSYLQWVSNVSQILLSISINYALMTVYYSLLSRRCR